MQRADPHEEPGEPPTPAMWGDDDKNALAEWWASLSNQERQHWIREMFK